MQQNNLKKNSSKSMRKHSINFYAILIVAQKSTRLRDELKNCETQKISYQIKQNKCIQGTYKLEFF